MSASHDTTMAAEASSAPAATTTTLAPPSHNLIETQALAFAVAALQHQESHDDDDEDDATQRLLRSRERNREHARRTRLRKKAQLQALQLKCQALQVEQQGLRQRVEERRIASILLGLSSSCGGIMSSAAVSATLLVEENNNTTTTQQKRSAPETCDDSTSRKRTKAAPDGVLSISIDGKPTTFNRRSHINWKSGMYTDAVTGHQRRLLPQQLEALRRERNRMHAKMTRDRKKCLIKTIESTIDELEQENARLRHVLAPTATKEMDNSTPMPRSNMMMMVTPELSSTQAPASTTSHGFVLE